METGTENPAHAISVHMCEEGMGSRGHGPGHRHCRVRAFFHASDNQSQYVILFDFFNYHERFSGERARKPGPCYLISHLRGGDR